MPDSFTRMGLHCMCVSAVKLYKVILKLYFICISAYINFIIILMILSCMQYVGVLGKSIYYI